jgi:hypothetical protein
MPLPSQPSATTLIARLELELAESQKALARQSAYITEIALAYEALEAKLNEVPTEAVQTD